MLWQRTQIAKLEERYKKRNQFVYYLSTSSILFSIANESVQTIDRLVESERKLPHSSFRVHLCQWISTCPVAVVFWFCIHSMCVCVRCVVQIQQTSQIKHRKANTCDKRWMTDSGQSLTLTDTTTTTKIKVPNSVASQTSRFGEQTIHSWLYIHISNEVFN